MLRCSVLAGADRPSPEDGFVVSRAMPQAPLKFCTWPGCRTRVPRGRCPTHRRAQQRLDDARYHKPGAIYKTQRWKRLRKAFLQVNPWCAAHLKDGSYIPATEVDHIIPIAARPDLTWEWDNLQSLCKPHHSSKTAKEVWHGKGVGASEKEDRMR